MRSAAYAASATPGPRSPPASASPARPRNSGGGGAIDDAVHQRDPGPGGPERAAERANPRAHSTVDGADLVDAQGPGAARGLDRPVLVPHRPGRRAAVAVRQVRLGRTGGPAGRADRRRLRVGVRASPVVPALRLLPGPGPVAAVVLPAALVPGHGYREARGRLRQTHCRAGPQAGALPAWRRRVARADG